MRCEERVMAILNRMWIRGIRVRAITVFTLCAAIFVPAVAHADVFGTVRGIVHDPQHRPVEGAMVHLSAVGLDWMRTVQTDADGEFLIDAVPAGQYTLEIAQPNFRPLRQSLVVNVGAAPILH